MTDSPTTEELIAGLTKEGERLQHAACDAEADGCIVISREIIAAADFYVAAASRLQALEAENERLTKSAERSEKNFYAALRALGHWPKLPDPYFLHHLPGQWPMDWERGKQMQRELGLDAIPPNTECELGAGFWNRITKPYREIEALTARLARLEGAANDVLKGGNHVALLIGANHPSADASFDEALAHYNAGDQYEAWCCWRTIMQLRAALSPEPPVNP